MDFSHAVKILVGYLRIGKGEEILLIRPDLSGIGVEDPVTRRARFAVRFRARLLCPLSSSIAVVRVRPVGAVCVVGAIYVGRFLCGVLGKKVDIPFSLFSTDIEEILGFEVSSRYSQ